MKLWNELKQDIISVEMLKYSLFGMGTAVIDVGTYLLCYAYLPIDSVLLTGVSNTAAWVLATIFAFFTNKLFVFRSRHAGRKKFLMEFFGFFGSRFFTWLISTLMLVLLVDGFHWNDFWSKILVSIFVIVTNYVVSKKLIFK